MKFLIILILITLMPGVSLAANTYSRTATQLIIDPSSSWLQYHPGTTFVFPTPDEPPKSSGQLNFGGFVEAYISEAYIDTLRDGSPRWEPVLFRNITIKFSELQLPSVLSEFSPDPIGIFRLNGNQISGEHAHGCDTSWAVGNMCSISVYSMVTDDVLSGSFDGEKLVVDGIPSHGFISDYYEFHVEASVIPLPAGVYLLVSGVICLFGIGRLSHKSALLTPT